MKNQTDSSCLLPRRPAHGKWTVILSDFQLNANNLSTIPENTVIKIVCDENFVYGGSDPIIYCENGKWNQEIEGCLGQF